jgi:hypothetical protein
VKRLFTPCQWKVRRAASHRGPVRSGRECQAQRVGQGIADIPDKMHNANKNWRTNSQNLLQSSLSSETLVF